VGLTNVGHVPKTLSEDHVGLGVAIRVMRARTGLSQEELAARSGMDRTYIGGIERGERNPGFDKLVRLARAFDIPTSELIAQSERERQPPSTT
jgi:transcriptional regulator with XRE-family HTH domain